jgi:hypothetical protein
MFPVDFDWWQSHSFHSEARLGHARPRKELFYWSILRISFFIPNTDFQENLVHSTYGGFLKWGFFLVIIHFQRIFHDFPTINQPFWGSPWLWKPPIHRRPWTSKTSGPWTTAGVRCTSLVEPCWKRWVADGQRWKKRDRLGPEKRGKNGICSWWKQLEKLGVMGEKPFFSS